MKGEHYCEMNGVVFPRVYSVQLFSTDGRRDKVVFRDSFASLKAAF